MRPSILLVAAAVAAACLADARADDKDGGARKPPAAARAKDAPAGIQWYATWDQGLAEAKKSGRPILLIAAAPQCHDVSGLW